MAVGTLMGAFPSPSSGEIDLGPFQVHAYGLMLLLGIVAATWMTGWRWTGRWAFWRDKRGDLVFRVAMWGVLAGIVGARLYHVITSWSTVDDEWWEPFAVWEGGLGVWGGIGAGVLVGAWVVRRSGESVYAFMDAAAPGLLLAQAIGRWGNYFNQELFGKPSDLPWALEIAIDNRPAEYALFETFHPTFLYESLWSLLGVGVLLLVDRRFSLKPPGLFALYVMWYCVGRFGMELLRIDEAHEFLGLRLNAWVSIVVFVLALLAFVWSQRREEHGRRPAPPPPASPPEGPTMAVPKGRVR
ncbi:MAG TPA: prolipoprotein diacylglyceryl transferase [Gaiellaceae bacterium]|nr:prolipoprotein diacylglyceryl transferase [Gaiellaceae bacterium]